jgi:hypothetical protein
MGFTTTHPVAITMILHIPAETLQGFAGQMAPRSWMAMQHFDIETIVEGTRVIGVYGHRMLDV